MPVLILLNTTKNLLQLLTNNLSFYTIDIHDEDKEFAQTKQELSNMSKDKLYILLNCDLKPYRYEIYCLSKKQECGYCVLSESELSNSKHDTGVVIGSIVGGSVESDGSNVDMNVGSIIGGVENVEGGNVENVGSNQCGESINGNSFIENTYVNNKQHQNYSKQHENYSKQRENYSKQHENYSKQHENYLKQHETYSKQHENYSKQHQTYSKQHETYSKQLQNHLKQIQLHLNTPLVSTTAHKKKLMIDNNYLTNVKKLITRCNEKYKNVLGFVLRDCESKVFKMISLNPVGLEEIEVLYRGIVEESMK